MAKRRTKHDVRDSDESCSTSVTVSMTNGLKETVESNAARLGWSKSQYVRACVVAVIDQRVTVWPRYQGDDS